MTTLALLLLLAAVVLLLRENARLRWRLYRRALDCRRTIPPLSAAQVNDILHGIGVLEDDS